MPLELNVKNFAKINNQSILPFYEENEDGQQKVFRKLEIDSNSLAGETWEFPEIFSSLVFPGKTSYAVEYYEEDYLKLYTSIKFKTEYSGTKTQFTITLVDSFGNEKVWVVISRNTATSAAWVTSWQNSYRRLHFISDNASLRNWLKQIAGEYKYEPFLYEPQFSNPAGYALSGIKDWAGGYLDIPDQHNSWNVVKINNSLFYNNKNIQKLILPERLDTIGNNAFQGAAFGNSSIVIPSTVREITSGAFKGTNLTKIEFQEDTSTSNLTIGFQSFADNYFLNEITLPTRLKQIEQLAFSNDSALKKVYYKGQIEDWLKINFANETSNPLRYGAGLYINNNEFTELSGSFNIPNYGFYGCGSLTKIELNKRESHTVGISAFANCPNLTSAELGWIDSLSGTFEDCHNLTSFNCSSNAQTGTSIGASSFKNTGLTSIENIQSNKVSIGYEAFYNTALKEVYFAYLQGTLGERAFAYNKLLETVNLWSSDNLDAIKSGAFRDCPKLELVILPGVSSFGTLVFYNDSNLKEVWYEGTKEDWMGATGTYKQFSSDSVKIICTDGYLTPIAGGSESYNEHGLYILKEMDTEDDYIKNTEVAVTGHEFWRNGSNALIDNEPELILTIPDVGDQKTFSSEVYITKKTRLTGEVNVEVRLENNYSANLQTTIYWCYYQPGAGRIVKGEQSCEFGSELKTTFQLYDSKFGLGGYWGFSVYSAPTAEGMARSEEYGVLQDGKETLLDDPITYTVNRKITEISGYSGFQYLSEVTLGTNIKKICSGTFQNCTKLSKIKYKGLRAQWASITKEDGWYDSDQEIEILCEAL